MAVVVYGHRSGRLVLDYTDVPDALSGQGIGSRLAAGVFAPLRESGRKAIATCPFLVAWAARHSDAADVILPR